MTTAGWNGKSNLEKTIAVGIHGTPQLKMDERRRFLGFFRERVIQAATFRQLTSKEGIQALVQAVHDQLANEVVVHAQARTAAMPVIIAARQKGVDFTITTNPKFVGEVAVVVVAKVAVDVATVLAEGGDK